jgi:UDP-glucose 4-epimerase
MLRRVARVLATGFDGVLHFAALSLLGESVEQPVRHYQTNFWEP